MDGFPSHQMNFPFPLLDSQNSQNITPITSAQEISYHQSWLFHQPEFTTPQNTFSTEPSQTYPHDQTFSHDRGLPLPQPAFTYPQYSSSSNSARIFPRHWSLPSALPYSTNIQSHTNTNTSTIDPVDAFSNAAVRTHFTTNTNFENSFPNILHPRQPPFIDNNTIVNTFANQFAPYDVSASFHPNSLMTQNIPHQTSTTGAYQDMPSSQQAETDPSLAFPRNFNGLEAGFPQNTVADTVNPRWIEHQPDAGIVAGLTTEEATTGDWTNNVVQSEDKLAGSGLIEAGAGLEGGSKRPRPSYEAEDDDEVSGSPAEEKPRPAKKQRIEKPSSRTNQKTRIPLNDSNKKRVVIDANGSPVGFNLSGTFEYYGRLWYSKDHRRYVLFQRNKMDVLNCSYTIEAPAFAVPNRLYLQSEQEDGADIIRKFKMRLDVHQNSDEGNNVGLHQFPDATRRGKQPTTKSKTVAPSTDGTPPSRATHAKYAPSLRGRHKEVEWRRVAFAHATENNGTRRHEQSFSVLCLKLIAVLEDRSEHVVNVASTRPLIVLARSPGGIKTKTNPFITIGEDLQPADPADLNLFRELEADRLGMAGSNDLSTKQGRGNKRSRAEAGDGTEEQPRPKRTKRVPARLRDEANVLVTSPTRLSGAPTPEPNNGGIVTPPGFRGPQGPLASPVAFESGMSRDPSNTSSRALTAVPPTTSMRGHRRTRPAPLDLLGVRRHRNLLLPAALRTNQQPARTEEEDAFHRAFDGPAPAPIDILPGHTHTDPGRTERLPDLQPGTPPALQAVLDTPVPARDAPSPLAGAVTLQDGWYDHEGELPDDMDPVGPIDWTIYFGHLSRP